MKSCRASPSTRCLQAVCAVLLTSCATTPPDKKNAAAPEPARQLDTTAARILISVAEQRMVLFEKGVARAVFPVSTSRVGLGDKPDSCCTPLGRLEVTEKIGDGLLPGARLDVRQPTGEIVPVDTTGRDPIVTRILRLRGMEKQNANAYERCIYIHGTPEEAKLKTPVSSGCVRMRSSQVIRLYDKVGTGTRVDIIEGKLPPPDQLPP